MRHFTEEQMAIEKLMVELGSQRYAAKANKARAKHRESTTAAGRYLLREAVGKMTDAIEAFAKTAETGGPGRRHVAVAYIQQLSAPVTALLAARVILDSISAERSFVNTAYHIGRTMEDEARCRYILEHDKNLFLRLKRQTKASSTSHRKKVFRGVSNKAELGFEPWTKRVKFRVGALLLEMLRDATGLIEIRNCGNGGKARDVVVATEDTLRWLEQSNEEHQALFPFYLPTLIVPQSWDNPFDGGYHSNIVRRQPLIKSPDRRYLAEVAECDMPEVYDAVNTLQATAWEINPDVFQVMEHCWEAGLAVADMASREDAKLPPKPDNIGEDEDARKQWRRDAAGVYAANVACRSQRLLTAKTLFMARQFLGETFYFPWQADFRGRLYPVPYFLQPQGQSQARGLLRFAEGRPMTSPEHVRWLGIHGANCFGVDKVSFDERLAWVYLHESEILAVHHDPLEHRWWEGASKPWEFLAFCLEWGAYKDALARGETFLTRLPVALDGSNNGLQIFSLLLRDPIGGAATNCTPSDAPRDIYQDVADLVTAKLVARGDAVSQAWLDFVGGRLPRAATKRPVMVLPYGGTRYSCQRYVTEWYRAEASTRGVRPWGPNSWQPCLYLASLVWDAIGETVVSARTCMSWLQQVARLCNEANIPVRWTSPSGFPVKQAYHAYRTCRITTVLGDTVRKHSLREELDKLDRRRQVNGISPNFVHSLDAAALAKTVNLARERGIESFSMIHDSYGVTCVDAPLMAATLRDVYAEMFSDNLLERFREEVQLHLGPSATIPSVPPSGSLDVNSLRRSDYFFA